MNNSLLVCGGCGHRMKVAGELTAGERFRCPRCRRVIEVPGAERPETREPKGHTVGVLPPHVPENPARARPRSDKKCENVEINGHVYTLQSGSAEQIKRMVANETRSGFGRVTPLPTSGPTLGFEASKATSGRKFPDPSENAAPRGLPPLPASDDDQADPTSQGGDPDLEAVS
jgi:hypothetical protein